MVSGRLTWFGCHVSKQRRRSLRGFGWGGAGGTSAHCEALRRNLLSKPVVPQVCTSCSLTDPEGGRGRPATQLLSICAARAFQRPLAHQDGHGAVRLHRNLTVGPWKALPETYLPAPTV